MKMKETGPRGGPPLDPPQVTSCPPFFAHYVSDQDVQICFICLIYPAERIGFNLILHIVSPMFVDFFLI